MHKFAVLVAPAIGAAACAAVGVACAPMRWLRTAILPLRK